LYSSGLLFRSAANLFREISIIFANPHPGGMPETVFIWDTGRLELNSVLRHRDAIKSAGECPCVGQHKLILVPIWGFYVTLTCKFVVFFH
jgi:hypothetical protein